jgi:Holliday junction resolvase
MSVNSKQKGARFERELSKIFQSYGYENARRTAQYCGNTGDASDVIGLPGIHVEAKMQERMRLYDWMAQAENDAGNNRVKPLPAVFHKQSRKEILVTMRLDNWMKLYQGYAEIMRLDEGGD